MKEIQVSQTGTRFYVGGTGYIAEFIPPVKGQLGLVEHENKWRLSELVYHSHRQGRPVQRKRQIPRTKLVGYFDSLDDCRQYLKDEKG